MKWKNDKRRFAKMLKQKLNWKLMMRNESNYRNRKKQEHKQNCQNRQKSVNQC